jgi:hypothetical protein
MENPEVNLKEKENRTKKTIGGNVREEEMAEKMEVVEG